MLPYPDIIEKADRRWTFRLLERLSAPGVTDGELDDLIESLQTVSDPRSLGPLEAVICSSVGPAHVREAAGYILRGMQYMVPEVPEEKLRSWWLVGDDVLRRHALLSMDGSRCPDIVVKVASDPTLPFQAEAIGRMLFWFDRPHHEAIKIAGLSHPNQKVRAAAADVLLWDEPVAAEGPLIQAAHDTVSEVAAEAANTLEYYPTLRTIRCLYDLRSHPSETVREEASDSYDSIRDSLLFHLCRKDRRVADEVRRWLRPIWDMLAFTEEELQPDEDKVSSVKNAAAREAMAVSGLLALLTDPDTSPQILGDRLWQNDWPAYRERERSRLRPVLLTHPDPLVRERAALCLEAWRDVPGLVELVRDPYFGVRKSAMYHLGRLPPTPGVADLAWEYLHWHDVLGVHATETLETFVRHAEPGDAIRQLGVIAADHGRREGLRDTALYHLTELGAVEQLAQVAGLLLEPPGATWALHLTLLRAAAELELPLPDIRHLREVDNLHVQVAVAQLET